MTSDNKSELEQSICFEELPKTLQDAINLTRHLKIRYLWVDSLCIIQGADDEAVEDWDDQSRCMNTVYRGALATILASSAVKANQGIFAERSALSSISCMLPKIFGSDEMIQLSGDLEDASQEPEPLKKRAWAFQEEFLSIRALSFGTKQLTWKCRGSQHRECDSESTFEVRPKETEAFQIHENWCSIIEEYSSKDLTRTTDKLPAIEGLSRLVQAHLPPYCASGLWEDRIVEQLLWRHLGKVTVEQRQHRRLANEKVPTWSWASVEGEVKFLKGADPTYCKVLALSDENIVVKAHMKKVSTLRLAVAGSYFGGYDNHLPWAIFPSSMRTYLDDISSIPQANCRVTPNGPAELVDVSFLFLGPDCGLILLREQGVMRLSQHAYGDLGSNVNQRAGGTALRFSLQLPIRRDYKRIGSFIGFGHGAGKAARPGRLSSTVVHLI
jgi:hypothetical protein